MSHKVEIKISEEAYKMCETFRFTPEEAARLYLQSLKKIHEDPQHAVELRPQ